MYLCIRKYIFITSSLKYGVLLVLIWYSRKLLACSANWKHLNLSTKQTNDNDFIVSENFLTQGTLSVGVREVAFA